jgi:predicted peptidase
MIKASVTRPIVFSRETLVKPPILSVLLLYSLITTPLQADEQTEAFQTTITKQVGGHYLVVLPEGYRESEQYPLLIFLHGRGEQGDDIEKVKIHGPFEKVRELGLPFIIVAPQCPLDEWWDVDFLEQVIERVLEKYPVDQQRIYLTGLSMGGAGTWTYACHRPDLFAAIAPVCGFGCLSKVQRIRDVPVWAFHGAKDDVVRPSETTDMINELYKTGNNARLTIYAEANHNAWEATYKNPQLYEWFLSHRKNDKEKPQAE